MPTLIINNPKSKEPMVVRTDDDQITIGRQSDSQVHLKSSGVSRHHAKIVTDGENFFLVDMESGNGTSLNGMRLRSNEKNLLKAGDIINIDEFQINFHETDDLFEINKSEEVTESDILEVKLLKKVLGALDKESVPSIEVLNGSSEGKKFLFTDEVTEIVIGRDPDCDFPINEHVMSRKHARITKRWGGIAIRDMESKNGCFVNNRRVVEEYLHDGDRIALGTLVFIFRNPQEINLANIEDIKPRNLPQKIMPEDIPMQEDGASEEAPEEGLSEEGGEENMQDEENWDEVREQVEQLQKYPLPQAAAPEKIKLITPLEIGMIGLGALVFLFALITIINLINS